MPSRARSRRLSPPAIIQGYLDDDFYIDVEVNYSDEEEDDEEASEVEEEEEEEGSEEQDEVDDEGAGDEQQENEEQQGQESTGEGCRPPVRARVSGGAAESHTCPVCMEAWTAQGAHRISCIPCGHVYGRSCLEKWLTQRGNSSAPCPQCGKRFRHKDIINLYAPEVSVPNNDLEKEVLYLRGKSESLEEKVMKHEKLLEEINERLLEVANAQKRQIVSEQRLTDVGSSKRQKMAEHSVGTTYLEPWTSVTADFSSSIGSNFILQNELPLDGARVMAIDAFNQIILASGRASGVGQEHVLSKSPGWSCSADESSHQICAGLQNGNLIIFDIRQTARPLHSMVGLSTHPVHTLHVVIDNNSCRKFLSASSIGPCMWDADGNQRRPKLLLGTENQGVCISLACAPPSSDVLVASFRPRVDSSEDVTTSQAYLSQTPTPSGRGKLGHHALIRRAGNSSSFTEDRTCCAHVSEVRMSKSAMIPCGNNQHLFAYGDESLRGVRTWQLPWLEMHTDLKPQQEPILDLRYAENSTGGRYLGCLSAERLQVFRIR